MNSFHIPDVLIDPIPSPLWTSEPSSFARNTFLVRIPRILQETIQENNFPPDILGAMKTLHDELARGNITALAEDAPDRNFWNTISRDYIGRSWLDVPWFWAETFFYRRVLEASQYFQPGNWHLVDPYRVKKQKELETAPRALNAALEALPNDPPSRFERLLHNALWGNRIDLSYNVAANIEQRAHDAERENILVDDTARVWELLRGGSRKIAFITDNTGTELLNDLALADFLLDEGNGVGALATAQGDREEPALSLSKGRPYASEIVLHLKAQPYFVSDAMPRDVEMSIDALAHGDEYAAALAHRLRGYVATSRLKLTTHWFYTTCLFYFQLPRDLIAQLAEMDLLILKGDANYRRLVGDAHWQPDASFRDATRYFPAPFVSLRTLKAEVVLGLKPGQAEILGREDADWMVNGRRGVIQANEFKVG